MIRAVAWDIDGTLIDSEPNHHKALLSVCERYGLIIADDDMRYVGIAMDAVWPMLQPNFPPELDRTTWLADIVDAYIAMDADLKPIRGALEAVEALAAAGIKQCCVSNSTSRIVEANLAVLGIGRYLDTTIGREDVVNGKPAAEPYALACRRLGLAPDAVLAVEDSDVGVASARAAGLDVLQYGRDFVSFTAVLERALAGGPVYDRVLAGL
jgi:HAD superfamily hydrolase (TIGR01509 family)